MSLELLLWLLLVFFIGCIIGYLLRRLFAPEPAAIAKTAAAEAGSTAAVAASRVADSKVESASPVVPARAASATPAKPKTVAAPKTAAAQKPKPAPKKKVPAAKPKKERATGKPKRPRGLAAAHGGKADNLQQISGVGPKLEKTLNGLGFFHFSQVAGWTSDEVLWVDEHLRFKGRIQRDKWISQAKVLAKDN